MKLCPTCRNTYPDHYNTCPLDQSGLAPLGTEILPGTVLRGKYEVLSQLGAGGMATVYKVRHLAFHEFAAVKVVHRRFLDDPEFLKRFRNEAVVARRLKHPNAVRIDDFDATEDGRPFIVMEFVDGVSLYESRRANPGPWPAPACVEIVAQAAEALGAAHALGIVHRDIKPGNLTLLNLPDDRIHLKVLDFGIAKVGAAGSFAGMTTVLTSTSVVIGTPEYMSPEQVTASLDQIDGRSDLYSLGLVLYELLTGSHPFRADTPMGMLLQQLNTPPPPPETIDPDVSPAISALVLKMLRKDPADRFQTAAELLTALRDPEGWYAATQPTPRLPAPVEATATMPDPAPVEAAIAPPAATLAPTVILEPAAAPATAPKTALKTALTTALRQSSNTKLSLLVVIGVVLAAICAAYVFFARVTPNPAPVVQTPQPVPRPVEPAQPAPVATTRPTTVPPPTVAAATPVSNPAAGPSTEARISSLMARNRYTEAFPLARDACDAGAARACEHLAFMYGTGNGTPQDYARAADLYRKGCDAHSAHSCANLGILYENALGVPHDQAQAVALYRQGCDANDPGACKNLGILYHKGSGVPQDYAQEAALYRKACAAGELTGCSNLGGMLDQGMGIPQDQTGAAVLFRKACSGGNAVGCANLASMYTSGSGVPRDPAEATSFYRKACDMKYPPACDLLKKQP